MKQTTVTCDNCSKDLTTTGNCVDYRIVLASEEIPSRGNVATLMNIEPQLDRPLALVHPTHLHQLLGTVHPAGAAFQCPVYRASAGRRWP